MRRTSPGASATKNSKKSPWKRLARRVRPPPSTLADERTISEIIGSPPSRPATTFASPCATRSRSSDARRRHGSSVSIAFAESTDSSPATIVKSATCFQNAGSASGAKSGNVTIAESRSGTRTRCSGPTRNTASPHVSTRASPSPSSPPIGIVTSPPRAPRRSASARAASRVSPSASSRRARSPASASPPISARTR